jgi:hypothetical protein
MAFRVSHLKSLWLLVVEYTERGKNTSAQSMLFGGTSEKNWASN